MPTGCAWRILPLLCATLISVDCHPVQLTTKNSPAQVFLSSGTIAIPIAPTAVLHVDETAHLYVNIAPVGGAQEGLRVLNPGNLEVSFHPALGELVIQGSPATSDFQEALRSVEYFTTNSTTLPRIRIAVITLKSSQNIFLGANVVTIVVENGEERLLAPKLDLDLGDNDIPATINKDDRLGANVTFFSNAPPVLIAPFGRIIYSFERLNSLQILLTSPLPNGEMERFIAFGAPLDSLSSCGIITIELPPGTTVVEASGVLQSLRYENKEVPPVEGLRLVYIIATSSNNIWSRPAQLNLNVEQPDLPSPSLLQTTFEFEENRLGAIARLIIMHSNKDATSPPTITLVNATHDAIAITRTHTLVITQSVDREDDTAQITANVLVSDGGSPPSTAVVAITINVLDRNDNGPVFKQGPTSLMIPETTVVGSVVALYKATDRDSGDFGRVKYRLSVSPQNETLFPFAINRTTGELLLVQILNFDQQKRFEFYVEAFDQGNVCEAGSNLQTGPCTTQRQVTVSVGRENVNPPVISNVPVMQSYLEGLITVEPFPNVTIWDGDNLESWESARILLSERNRLSRFFTCPNQHEFHPLESVWQTCHLPEPFPLFTNATVIGESQLVTQKIAVFPALTQGYIVAPALMSKSTVEILHGGFFISMWVRQVQSTNGYLLSLISLDSVQRLHLGIFSDTAKNTLTVSYRRNMSQTGTLQQTKIEFKLFRHISLQDGDWHLLSFGIQDRTVRLLLDCTNIPLQHVQYYTSKGKLVMENSPFFLPSDPVFPNKAVLAVFGARATSPTTARFHFSGQIAAPSLFSACESSETGTTAKGRCASFHDPTFQWCCTLGCGSFLSVNTSSIHMQSRQLLIHSDLVVDLNFFKSNGPGIVHIQGDNRLQTQQLQPVLRRTIFSNQLDEPAIIRKQTIMLEVDDGLFSSSIKTSMNFVAVNTHPPILNLGGKQGNFSVIFTQGGHTVILSDPDRLSITDADIPSPPGMHNELTFAHVNLTSAPNGLEEQLIWDEPLLNELKINVSVQNQTGASEDARFFSALFTGLQTLDAYRSLLATLAYVNTAGVPKQRTRVIEWFISDGKFTSELRTTIVSIAFVNEPPRIFAGGPGIADATAILAIGQQSVPIAPNAVVIFSGDIKLTSITLALQERPIIHETLTVDQNFASSLGILVSLGQDSSQITLSNVTSANSVASVIHTAIYRIEAFDLTNTTTSPRIVEIQIQDTLGDTSLAALSIVYFASSTNNPPLVDLSGIEHSGVNLQVTFEMGGPPLLLAPSAQIRDVDDSTLVFMSIQLSHSPDHTFEGITVPTSDVPEGVSFTQPETGSHLVFEGVARLEVYTAILQKISYFNFASVPVPGKRTITVEVIDRYQSDPFHTSALAAINVSVILADNRPPAFFSPTNLIFNVSETVILGTVITKIVVSDIAFGKPTTVSLVTPSDVNSANLFQLIPHEKLNSTCPPDSSLCSNLPCVTEDNFSSCPDPLVCCDAQFCVSSSCALPTMPLRTYQLVVAAPLEQMKTNDTISLRILLADFRQRFVSESIVTIHIQPANASALQFVQRTFTVDLLRMHAVGEPVLQLRVQKLEDLSEIPFLDFGLDSSLDASLFAINATSGKMTLTSTLANVDSDDLRFNVFVTALSRPDLGTASASVIVTLVDNMHAPHFPFQTLEVNVSTAVTIGYELAEFTVTDADKTPPHNNISVNLHSIDALAVDIPFELETVNLVAVSDLPGRRTVRMITNTSLNDPLANLSGAQLVLKLVAFDGGEMAPTSTSLVSEATISIHISPLDSQPPRFEITEDEPQVWVTTIPVGSNLFHLIVRSEARTHAPQLKVTIMSQTIDGLVKLVQETNNNYSNVTLALAMEFTSALANTEYTVQLSARDTAVVDGRKSTLMLTFTIENPPPLLHIHPLQQEVSVRATSLAPFSSTKIKHANNISRIHAALQVDFSQFFDFLPVDCVLQNSLNLCVLDALDLLQTMAPSGALQPDSTFSQQVWTFNGINTFGVVQTPSEMVLGDVTNHSLSCMSWVKVELASSNGYIFAKTNTDGEERFFTLQLVSQSKALVFTYMRPRSSSTSPSNARVRVSFHSPKLFDGYWHHVAVIFRHTSNTILAYVDGHSLGAPQVSYRTDTGILLTTRGNPLLFGLTDGVGILMVGARRSAIGVTALYHGSIAALALIRDDLSQRELLCLIKCSHPISLKKQVPMSPPISSIAGRCMTAQASFLIMQTCGLNDAEMPFQELLAIHSQNFDLEGALIMVEPSYSPFPVASLGLRRIEEGEGASILACVWLQLLGRVGNRSGYIFSKSTPHDLTLLYGLFVHEPSQELVFRYRRGDRDNSRTSMVAVQFSIPTIFDDAISWHHICISIKNVTIIAIIDGLEILPASIMLSTDNETVMHNKLTLPSVLFDAEGIFLLGVRLGNGSSEAHGSSSNNFDDNLSPGSGQANFPITDKLSARIADPVFVFQPASFENAAWRCIASCGSLLNMGSLLSSDVPGGLTVLRSEDGYLLDVLPQFSGSWSRSSAVTIFEGIRVEFRVRKLVAWMHDHPFQQPSSSMNASVCMKSTGILHTNSSNVAQNQSVFCLIPVNQYPPLLDLDISSGPKSRNASQLFFARQREGTSPLDWVFVDDSDGLHDNMQVILTLLNPKDGNSEYISVCDTARQPLDILVSTAHEFVARGASFDIVELLRTLQYSNEALFPDMATRFISVRVVDQGGQASDEAFLIVNMHPVRGPPAVSGTVDLDNPYIQGTNSHPILSSLTISDPSSSRLMLATIELVNRFEGEAEILFMSPNATLPSGMTVVSDAFIGMLLITGEASVEDYEVILLSIRFVHKQPSQFTPGTRKFRIRVQSTSQLESNLLQLEFSAIFADKSPNFAEDTPTIARIKEGVPIGTFVTLALATSEDGHSSSSIRYSFNELEMDNKTLLLFSINPLNGRVTTSGSIVYDLQRVHLLIIMAKNIDQSFPRPTTLKVRIDVVDQTPRFLTDEYLAQLPRQALPGTQVDILGEVPLKAEISVPNEGIGIVYSLRFPGESTLSEILTIDLNTAIIRSNHLSPVALLDNISWLVVYVVANTTHAPFLSSQARLNVTLITKSKFLIADPKFIEIDALTVVGTVVASASVFDVSTGLPGWARFSLQPKISYHNFPFSINASTGIIFLNSSLVGTQQQEFVFAIFASDLGKSFGESLTMNVTVHVLNLFPNMPEISVPIPNVIRLSQRSSIGSVVLQLNATDPDRIGEEHLTFSVDSNSKEVPFRVIAAHDFSNLTMDNIVVPGSIAAIVVSAPLDLTNYTLNVTVYDTHNSHRRSSHILVISVMQLLLETVKYVVNVSESATLHQPISLPWDFATLISKSDLLFTVESVFPEPDLSLAANGTLFVNSVLNASRLSEYILEASVRDASGNKDSATIQVIILPLINTPPRLNSPAYEFHIRENSLPNTPLMPVTGLIKAFDKDFGPNGELRFSLSHIMEELLPFEIDKMTGQLLTSFVFSRIPLSFYIFDVIVQDLGRPPLSDSARVVVRVLPEKFPAVILEPASRRNISFIEGDENVPVFGKYLILSHDAPEQQHLTNLTLSLSNIKNTNKSMDNLCGNMLETLLLPPVFRNMNVSVKCVINPFTTTIHVQGTFPLLTYQRWLRRIQYTNTDSRPIPGRRSVILTVQSGLQKSNSLKVYINVFKQNNQPFRMMTSLQVLQIIEDNTHPSFFNISDILPRIGGDMDTLPSLSQLGVVVIDVDEMAGAWQYQLFPSGNWFQIANVSIQTSLPLASANIRLVPAPGFTGVANISVLIWDQTKGESGAKPFNVSEQMRDPTGSVSAQPVQLQIEVQPFPRPPLISRAEKHSDVAVFIEGNHPVLLFSDISITDPDSKTLAQVSIRITNSSSTDILGIMPINSTDLPRLTGPEVEEVCNRLQLINVADAKSWVGIDLVSRHNKFVSLAEYNRCIQNIAFVSKSPVQAPGTHRTSVLTAFDFDQFRGSPSNLTATTTTSVIVLRSFSDLPFIFLKRPMERFRIFLEPSEADHDQIEPLAVAPSVSIALDDSEAIMFATISLLNSIDLSEEGLFMGGADSSVNLRNFFMIPADSVHTLEYQLRNIQFVNRRREPTPGVRTVRFRVSDGSRISNVLDVFVHLQNINDRPTQFFPDGNSSVFLTNFFEGNLTGISILSPNARFIDNDNQEYPLIRVIACLNEPALGTVGSQQLFIEKTTTLATSTHIEITANNTCLTVHSTTGSQEDYLTALQAIRYVNTELQFTGTSRSVTFFVEDILGISTTAVTVITLITLNEPPTLVAVSNTTSTLINATFRKDGIPVSLSPAAKISDDDGILQSMTIALLDMPDGDSDILVAEWVPETLTATFCSFSQQLVFVANVTLAMPATNTTCESPGLLQIFGRDSVAAYQQTLRNVKFINTVGLGNDPSSLTRRVRIKVFDVAGKQSNAIIVHLILNPRNQPPQILFRGETISESDQYSLLVVNYTAGTGSRLLLPDAQIIDMDSLFLVSLRAYLINHPDEGMERLILTLPADLIYFNSTQLNGTVVSFEVPVKAMDLSRILQSLQYENLLRLANLSDRFVGVNVSDGVDTTTVVFKIRMFPANIPPVIKIAQSNPFIATFQEGSPFILSITETGIPAWQGQYALGGSCLPSCKCCMVGSFTVSNVSLDTKELDARISVPITSSEEFELLCLSTFGGFPTSNLRAIQVDAMQIIVTLPSRENLSCARSFHENSLEGTIPVLTCAAVDSGCSSTFSGPCTSPSCIQRSAAIIRDDDNKTLVSLEILLKQASYGDEIVCNESLAVKLGLKRSVKVTDKYHRYVYTSKGAVLISDMRDFLVSCGFINTASEPRAGFREVEVVVFDGMDSSKPAVMSINLEIRDRPPVFDLTDYSANISASAPIGTGIVNVSATDPNGKSVFYILSHPQFAIDRTSGLITTIQLLEPSILILQVIAFDGVFNSTVLFNVHIYPAPPPVFSLDQYFGRILDNATARTPVLDAQNRPLTVTAIDVDFGNSIQIMFVLEGNDSQPFQLDPKTSILFVKDPEQLNVDLQVKHQFMITAFSQGLRESARSSAPIEILVINTNNHNPVFDQATIAPIFITENTPVNTILRNIKASDKDSGPSGRVIFLLNDGSDMSFSILPNGSLVLTSLVSSPLLDEQKIILSIEARDLGDPPRSTFTNLTVILFPIPRVCPHLNLEPPTQTVFESAEPKTFLTSVYLQTFDNETIHSNLTVEINILRNQSNVGKPTSVSKYPQQQVNIFLGTLVLDHSVAPIIVLSIHTSIGRCTLNANFTLIVVAAPDGPPVPETTLVHSQIMENAPAGTLVAQLNATDPANRRVIFFLLDTNVSNPYFDVSMDGEVRSLKPISGSEVQQLTLIIGVSNLAFPVRQKSPIPITVKIQIVPVNKHPPVISSDLTVSIEENNGIGDLITTITAIDKDKGDDAVFKFSILGGNDDGAFNLSRNTGELRAAKMFDREERDLYALLIRISDSGVPVLHTTVTLTVVILERNEPPRIAWPKFFEVVSVMERLPIGATVFSIVQADSDHPSNRDNIFTLQTTPSNVLTIDRNSGKVSMVKIVYLSDHPEGLSVITFATVRDRHDPTLFSTVRFTVQFTAIIHDPPILIIPAEIDILENISIGSAILFVNTTTSRHSDESNLRYHILSTTLPNNTLLVDFVNATEPVLVSVGLFDFETIQSFVITLETRDVLTKLSHTADLRVNILPAVNRTPTFLHPPLIVSVLETISDISLTQVRATSAATGADIVYHLVNGTTIFSINATSGVLRLDEPLDFASLRGGQMIVSVRAIYSAPPFPFSETTVSILVVDTNNSAPVLTANVTALFLLEGTYVDVPLLELTARNPNTSIFGPVSLSILSSDGFPGGLVLDVSTGIVRTSPNPIFLDHAIQRFYNVTFIARNEGPVPLTDTLTVPVNIIDVNAHTPVVTNAPPSVISIPETFEIGRLLFAIQATDADSGENGRISYILNSTTFAIDPDKGQVRLAEPLDFSAQSEHELRIRVTDNGSPPRFVWVNVTVRVSLMRNLPPQFCALDVTTYCEAIDTLNVTVVELTHGNIPIRAEDVSQRSPDRRLVYFGFGHSQINVDSSTGLISYSNLKFDPNRPSIHFEVFVRDFGSPRLTAILLVRFNIVETNKHSPQIFLENIRYLAGAPQLLPFTSIALQDNDTSLPWKSALVEFTRLKTCENCTSKPFIDVVPLSIPNGGAVFDNIFERIVLEEITSHAVLNMTEKYIQVPVQELNDVHDLFFGFTFQLSPKSSGYLMSWTVLDQFAPIMAVFVNSTQVIVSYNAEASPSQISIGSTMLYEIEYDLGAQIDDNAWHMLTVQLNFPQILEIYVDETAIQASRRKDPDGTTKLPPNIFPLPRAPVFNDNNVIYLGARIDPIKDIDGLLQGSIRTAIISAQSLSMEEARCLTACKQNIGVSLRSSNPISAVQMAVENTLTSRLEFTGEASIEAYNDALLSVFVWNDFRPSSFPTALLSVIVFDGKFFSNFVERTIIVVNSSQPLLNLDFRVNGKDANLTTVFVENGKPVPISPFVQYSDAGSEVTTATVIEASLNEAWDMSKEVLLLSRSLVSPTVEWNGTKSLWTWDFSRSPLTETEMTEMLRMLHYVNNAQEPRAWSSRLICVRVFNGAFWSNMISISVDIKLVNDNAPNITAPLFIEVVDSISVGSTVTHISVTDADSCPSKTQTSCPDNQVSVWLEADPEILDIIQINVDKTAILLTRTLDRTQLPLFFFNITARDHGTPPLTSIHGPVTVRVWGTGDKFPTITDNVITASVFENSTVGTIVTTIGAHPPVATPSATLSFRLKPSTPFAINSSGVVTVNETLDFETIPSYSLIVTVSSGKFTDSAFLDVNVINVNDNPPDVVVSELRLSSYIAATGPQFLDPLILVEDPDELGLQSANVLVSSAGDGLQCESEHVTKGSARQTAPHSRHLRCRNSHSKQLIQQANFSVVSVIPLWRVLPLAVTKSFGLTAWLWLSHSNCSLPFFYAQTTGTPFLAIDISTSVAIIAFKDSNQQHVTMTFPIVIPEKTWVHAAFVLSTDETYVAINTNVYNVSTNTINGSEIANDIKFSLVDETALHFTVGSGSVGSTCKYFESHIVGVTLHYAALAHHDLNCLMSCGERLQVTPSPNVGLNIQQAPLSSLKQIKISGASSLRDYSELLRNVTYEHTLYKHPLTMLNVSFSVNDGLWSAQKSWKVDLIPVLVPPHLNSWSPNALVFTEGFQKVGTPVSLSQLRLSISDASSVQLDSIYIQLSEVRDNTEEKLFMKMSPEQQLHITMDTVSVLLKGPVHLDILMAAFENLAYVNEADNPISGNRLLSVNVTNVLGLSSLYAANISVISINDNPPVALMPEQTARLAENLPPETVIPDVVLNASDPDNDPLIYSVLVPWDSHFAVVGLQLITLVSLDFEANPNGINVTVLISDGLFNTTILVKLEIIDMFEPPIVRVAQNRTYYRAFSLSDIVSIDPGEGKDMLRRFNVTLPLGKSQLPRNAVVTTLQCRDESRLSVKLSFACKASRCSFTTTSILNTALFKNGAIFEPKVEIALLNYTAGFAVFPTAVSDMLVSSPPILDQIAVVTWIRQTPGTSGMVFAKSIDDFTHILALHSDSQHNVLTLHYFKAGETNRAIGRVRSVFQLPSGISLDDGVWHLMQIVISYPSVVINVDGLDVLQSHYFHRPDLVSPLVRVNSPALGFIPGDAIELDWFIGGKQDAFSEVTDIFHGSLSGLSFLRRRNNTEGDIYGITSGISPQKVHRLTTTCAEGFDVEIDSLQSVVAVLQNRTTSVAMSVTEEATSASIDMALARTMYESYIPLVLRPLTLSLEFGFENFTSITTNFTVVV